MNDIVNLSPWITLLLIIILFQSQPLKAKETKIRKGIAFKHLSVIDGMSQNSIVDMVQDKHGFLWIGTTDGLNRYDGYTFKVYSNSKNAPSSLSASSIRVTYISSTGDFWVGTEKGLDLFNPQNDTFMHITLDKSAYSVQTIYEDSNNRLWVGTNKGLYHQDSERQTFHKYHSNIPEAQQLAHSSITSIIEGSQGQLWIGTSKEGLYNLTSDKKSLNHYKNAPKNPLSLSNNNVKNIYKTSHNEVWVATSNGLNRYDNKSDSFERFIHNKDDSSSLSENLIYCLLEDSKGVLWVGTAHGLNKFDRDSNSFTAFFHDTNDIKSLSGSSILSMYEDKYGLLWLGTSGSGVNIYDPISHHFAGYQVIESINNNFNQKYTTTIYEDSTGTLWLGGRNELVALNRKASQYTHFQHNPLIKSSLRKGTPYAILEDRNNQLWIGSFLSGLSNLDRVNEQFNYYQVDPELNDGLTFNSVISIYEDVNKSGDVILWLGTDKGLWQFNTETKVFHNFNLGVSNYTFSIVGEGENKLWVAILNEGLFHVNKIDRSFIQYRHDELNENSLVSNKIAAIDSTEKGHLWIGTTSGLDYFDTHTKKFTHYNITHGLPNNTIYKTLQDDNGNIWVSTNKGLSRLNITTNKFKNFDVSDGLQSNEFNMSSGYKSEKGEFFFGGVKGFNAFFPENLSEHKVKPDIAITNFSLFNKNVPISSAVQKTPLENTIESTQKIILTHEDYVFSFDFSVIHFANPMKNQYKYQLLGFDKEWVETNAKMRHATYTNIPSGDYIFKVKGSNKDGVWNNTSRNIKITVLPAPWHTWWAYLLYVISILAILGSFFYRRFKISEKIRKSEERLSMALWGSGDQFWDFNMATKEVHRVNVLDGFSTPVKSNTADINELSIDIHPDDQTYFLEKLTDSMEGKVDIFEITYRLKNIQKQWVWVMNKGRIVSRDINGKTLRMAGVLINVHELYETQCQLKELNQSLEDKVKQRTNDLQESINTLKGTQEKLIQTEKMAALGDLVAGFAHEVNTPLGICVTILSLQLDTLNNLKTEYANGELTAEHIEMYMNKSEEQLIVAQRNSNRAATLVKSFKQISVDQSHEVLSEMNINDYIEIIISSNSPKIKQAKVTLNLLIPKDFTFKTIPGTWAQIITNLLDNSIAHAFTDSIKDREITIEVKNNEHIELIYTDNGIGMSDEISNRVFEPFYTTKRGQGGSGLGMHIVYNLVTQKLKGTIECISKPNKGTRFIIVCNKP